MSSVAVKEPETVRSWVEEEHYERLWKIKGLPTSMENRHIELIRPLELETSADSPLHSKWIISLGKGLNHTQMMLMFKLDTIYNEGIKEIQCQVTAEFRFDPQVPEETLRKEVSSRVNQWGSLVVSWDRPTNGNWNWDDHLNSEGEMVLYIKLTLYNSWTENLEEKFKRESVANTRQNLTSLLDGGRTDVDVKIVCSDAKEIKCHQGILKANSPVFKTMLESGFTEAQSGVINVSDIGGATMEVLVQYMYTGQLRNALRDPEIILDWN